MFGHPALRLLMWLKLRGGLRMQVRKLRRPSSWIFLALGLLLMFGWVFAVVFGRGGQPPQVAPEVLRLGVELGLIVLLTLTVVGAFQHRGLYLPKEEIELAFSAPVTRSQLVRYRLATNLLRSLLAALIFGLVASRRLPGPGWAFAGTLVVMLTIPVVGQLVALLLGESENRIGKLARKLPLRVVSTVLGAAVGGGLVWALLATNDGAPPVLLDREGWIAAVAQHPVVRAVTLPVEPWARMITAGDGATFLPWFLACAGGWLLLYEAATRLRIDYRELSLATSADVAKRIQLARRGGWSASQSAAAGGARGRSTPWIFGRGKFGAVAWLELTSMLRRARGTLVLSVLVVVLLVLLTGTFGRGGGDDPETAAHRSLLAGSSLIALLGTVYLCAGLRFDFRGRLDHMEAVKAWPLPPWQVFLATILPEVLLVATILVGAMLARAAWIGAFHPALVAFAAFQPLIVLTWVALDNAVFLRAPVRYVPGQESALQHMGRSMILLLLRFVILVLVGAVAVGPAVGLGFLLHLALDVPEAASIAAAVAVAWLGTLAVDAALVWLGGRMLGRFDVARDRGV